MFLFLHKNICCEYSLKCFLVEKSALYEAVCFGLFLTVTYVVCTQAEALLMSTVNVLKFHFIPSFFVLMFYFCAVVSKILSGMANSVDPDQEQSDLGLHCLHMKFCKTLVYEILGHLQYPQQMFFVEKQE